MEEKTVGDPSPRLLEPDLDMPRMRVYWVTAMWHSCYFNV